MKTHDIGIIGGGPGGSTLASYLTKKGYDVALFEKEPFPRFRIGESLLPCSMEILKETGVYSKIDSGKYLRKYGARFIDHSNGETVLFNFGDSPFPDHRMSFEVERCKFDADLLDHAKELGTTVYQPVRVDDIEENPDHIVVKTDKEDFRVKYLADASGRIAVIGNKKKMRQPNVDLINNIGVFSHFTGVQRDEGIRAGDIIISVLPNKAWAWTIPFACGKTSVGVVTNTKLLPQGTNFDQFLTTTLDSTPIFRDMMKNAKRVAEVQAYSNYSHTCESMIGDRWLQVGDAAAFLDPIFSSGAHVSMYTAKLASEVIDKAMLSNKSIMEKDLGGEYQDMVRKGVTRFHKLIRLFYDTNFVQDTKKILSLKLSRDAFTSAVAGDVWNDDNVIFRMGNL